MKKYKKSDLVVIDYGTGRKKRFIIYTDYKMEFGHTGRYYTRVYPDVRGNKTKATKEALQWLNEGKIGKPWIVKDKESKIFLQYEWGA